MADLAARPVLAFRPQLKEIRVPGQRVNQLFTIMKKGLRTDFGPRQSPSSISKRRLQETPQVPAF
jgi:hypothetical protein